MLVGSEVITSLPPVKFQRSLPPFFEEKDANLFPSEYMQEIRQKLMPVTDDLEWLRAYLGG